jgi:hypothetical protein
MIEFSRSRVLRQIETAAPKSRQNHSFTLVDTGVIETFFIQTQLNFLI